MTQGEVMALMMARCNSCTNDNMYEKLNEAHNEGYDVGYWAGRRDYEPRWIPVTERLPEEPYGCLVTVWDTNPVTMDEFENILPYFVGWDGSQWNDADGEQCPFEVIAWMPLPKPYKTDEVKE